jgi:hypothetical protein
LGLLLLLLAVEGVVAAFAGAAAALRVMTTGFVASGVDCRRLRAANKEHVDQHPFGVCYVCTMQSNKDAFGYILDAWTDATPKDSN